MVERRKVFITDPPWKRLVSLRELIKKRDSICLPIMLNE
jgi:hypothetical protein